MSTVIAHNLEDEEFIGKAVGAVFTELHRCCGTCIQDDDIGFRPDVERSNAILKAQHTGIASRDPVERLKRMQRLPLQLHYLVAFIEGLQHRVARASPDIRGDPI